MTVIKRERNRTVYNAETVNPKKNIYIFVEKLDVQLVAQQISSSSNTIQKIYIELLS